MKYTEVVKAIVEHVGGKDNISVATHCMTRLRLNLKDSSKVEEDALKKLDGVMGVVNKGQQTQIIIGASVNEVYSEFIEYTGMKEEAPVEENLDELKQDLKNRKGNLLTVFFETVAGIFNPIVPALAGAGLVRAILTIAVVCGLDNTGNTYMVINTIANGIFTFLPFLLAASAAKQFKMDTFVAMTICAGMMSSTWATLIGEGVSAFSFSVYAGKLFIFGAADCVCCLVCILGGKRASEDNSGGIKNYCSSVPDYPGGDPYIPYDNWAVGYMGRQFAGKWSDGII